LVVFLCFVCIFETGTLHVVQVGLKLINFLPQSPECLCYRCVLPCPTCSVFMNMNI
jgi:hypothetical protein